MNSNDRNQPEKNRENLCSNEAVQKIKDNGDAAAGIKMLIGAAIGRTLDDSIQGNASV